MHPPSAAGAMTAVQPPGINRRRRDRAENWIEFARVRALGGIDVLRAAFTTRVTPPHSHPEFEIGVIESGGRMVHCRGAIRKAEAGSILVFRPGEPHWGEPLAPGGSTYRSFFVASDVVEPAGASESPWFGGPVVADPELAGQLVDLHRAIEAGETDLARDAELRESLRLLATRHRGPAPSEPRLARHRAAVARAKRFLEDNYAGRVRLEEVAAAAGVSVFHLVRVFHAATGRPPYAYLEQVRVDRAAALLRAGLPVSEVAFRTGFGDQSHLTRFFTRLVGVPPGRYRRQMLGPLGCARG